MKTAISIPDDLFKVAEETAEKFGMSRSSLYSKAIKEFIYNHNPQQVTEILNKTYDNQDSKMDETIMEMQFNSLDSEDW